MVQMNEPQNAGGMATQRGIDFQNRVAGWFAVSALLQQSGLAELPNSPIERLYFETSEPVSDLMLATKADGFLFVEVKHSLSSSPSHLKPLLEQFLRQWVLCEEGLSSAALPWRRPLEISRDRFLLVCSHESPLSLRKHLAACISRVSSISDGEPLSALAHNKQEAQALTKFLSELHKAWRAIRERDATDQELRRFLQVFRIKPLDVEAGHSEERLTVAALASVISHPDQADSAWAAIRSMCGKAGADRLSMSVGQLQSALEDVGIPLATLVSFRPDIEKLKSVTKRTMLSLEHLASLRAVPKTVSIKRNVTRVIQQRAQASSLLVIGEPGAGKSGVLFELGEVLNKDSDVVFLAVDRFEGKLETELGLEHDLEEVLTQWKGDSHAYLIIDALDAARGKTASVTILRLMRAVIGSSSRWRVVASIRSFDLKYSPDLQDLFRRPLDQSSPDDYESDRFPTLNHVSVPRFSAEEIDEIRSKIPPADEVFLLASPPFAELLRTPFNLRLLCDLIFSGLTADELGAIRTQTALLDRYWEYRVLSPIDAGPEKETVLTTVLDRMTGERRLSVKRSQMPATATRAALTTLLSDEVLIELEENILGRFTISFSHHLLFDYAGSRLLVLNDLDRFLGRLAGEEDLILFLRPSVVLAFRDLWIGNRTQFWRMARRFSTQEGVPSVARLIAPTVIADHAHSMSDLAPLVELLSDPRDDERRRAEDWLIHSVGAMLADNSVRFPLAWAELSKRVSASSLAPRLVGALQTLNSLLIEHHSKDEAVISAVNTSAINILRTIVNSSQFTSWLRARAITDLMRVYATNPNGSSQVLRQLFTPESLAISGFSDGPWIARNLSPIFSVDPTFVEDFYTAVFSYQDTSKEATPMGASQIMPMTSNRRQDYQHMWWELARIFPAFCDLELLKSARIVCHTLNAYVEREHRPKSEREVVRAVLGDGTTVEITCDYSSIWDSGYGDSRDEPLQLASTFYRALSRLVAAQPSAAGPIFDYILCNSKYAVGLRRLLNVATEHAGYLSVKFLPFCTNYTALVSIDLSSTIGEFLKKVFPLFEPHDRSVIEAAILAIPVNQPEEKLEIAEQIRDRLFGCLDSHALVTHEAKRHATVILARGGAPPNRPPFQMGGVQVGQYTSRDFLAEKGVDVDNEANKRLHDIAESYSGFKGVHNNDVPSIAEAQNKLSDLRRFEAAIRAWERDGVDEREMLYAEGMLVAVCSSISRNRELDRASDLGNFIKEVLLSALASSIPEHDPQYDARFDEHQAWSSPAQRIDATIGLYNLAAISGFTEPEVETALRVAISDPVPAVRFQAAIRVTGLHDTNRELMWGLIDVCSEQDESIGVVSGLLSYSLNRLAGPYPADVVQRLAIIMQRFESRPKSEGVTEWIYRIAAGLYVWQDRSDALRLFEPLLTEQGFDAQRASQLLRDMREVYTHRADTPSDGGRSIRRRAFQLSEKVARLAGAKLLTGSDSEPPERVREFARTLDYISNQIYFGSGAYDGQSRELVLNDEERSTFWTEARSVIDALTEVALPSIAHNLIKTLQSFIPIEPAEVFHKIASVVRSAERFGYQYDSLAVELLVEITELYLAQYPTLLQQDEQCRRELMYVLETFVNAGWPSALRLIYRLEEIYR